MPSITHPREGPGEAGCFLAFLSVQGWVAGEPSQRYAVLGSAASSAHLNLDEEQSAELDRTMKVMYSVKEGVRKNTLKVLCKEKILFGRLHSLVLVLLQCFGCKFLH